MTLLEKAIGIALEIHAGQKDKAGLPYILHPLTVMLQMDTDDERVTAVLHDTIEDSRMTLDQLRQQLNLPDHIVEALDLLTHDKNALSYDQYIERLRPYPLARKVKLADLRHNMEVTRIRQMAAKDMERLARYHRAWQKLNRT
jgi:(p)ppGpp synthase/HD superfamily hydrolase